MKKLLIVPAIIGLLSTGVYATGKTKIEKFDDGDRVSYSVKNQFQADFRNATNVVWTITDNCQKAEFISKGVKKTAFYSLAGEFLGTTSHIAYSEIPADAQKEIAEKYKGYTVGQVIELQTWDTVQRFVDLKSDKEEILVRVSPTASVNFFKQVK